MIKKVPGKGPTEIQQHHYLVRRSVTATEQSIKQHCAQTRAAPLEIVTLTEIKHKDVYFPLREPQKKYA